MTTAARSKKERRKTVLVVEDQKYNLLVLKKMLEQSGINVIPVENGMDAIKVCEQNKEIDLVLMDIKMPVMDGYNAMKEIKKLVPEMKVIAETAYALSGDRSRILDAGFDGYLPKPITKESLDEIINLNLK
jgi:two-component system, cell cycle response regulator DivK